MIDLELFQKCIELLNLSLYCPFDLHLNMLSFDNVEILQLLKQFIIFSFEILYIFDVGLIAYLSWIDIFKFYLQLIVLCCQVCDHQKTLIILWLKLPYFLL